MKKIIKLTEQDLTNIVKRVIRESDISNSQKLPEKTGWYWVLIEGYSEPTPCYYMGPDSFSQYEEGDEYFLPGGIGDSSSNGVYLSEINKIGPEIEVPIF
jgi:hypothetical protein